MILISVKMNTETIKPFSMTINIYVEVSRYCSVLCLPRTIICTEDGRIACSVDDLGWAGEQVED